jgi:2'-5' RNA ligase
VSVRLFAAVELPDVVRDALAGFGSAAARDDAALRAAGAQTLHLTLAFLGDRTPEEVAPAAAAVAAVSAGAPRLELGDALWLAPRRPHVLTVAVRDADGALAALHAEVVARLAAALPAWAPERRPLRPHVTVARVRQGVTPRTAGLPDVPRATWSAGALALFRSHLGDGPARYEAVARARLG